MSASNKPEGEVQRKHGHYFKACPYPYIDVYRTLEIFNVTNPCIQHAVKKLLFAGERGGGKELSRDIQEAIDTLERWKTMQQEERFWGDNQ